MATCCFASPQAREHRWHEIPHVLPKTCDVNSCEGLLTQAVICVLAPYEGSAMPHSITNYFCARRREPPKIGGGRTVDHAGNSRLQAPQKATNDAGSIVSWRTELSAAAVPQVGGVSLGIALPCRLEHRHRRLVGVQHQTPQKLGSHHRWLNAANVSSHTPKSDSTTSTPHRNSSSREVSADACRAASAFAAVTACAANQRGMRCRRAAVRVVMACIVGSESMEASLSASARGSHHPEGGTMGDDTPSVPRKREAPNGASRWNIRLFTRCQPTVGCTGAAASALEVRQSDLSLPMR